MDELKVGDVVWHTKKGYVGRIKSLGYGKDNLDCRIIVLSDYWLDGYKRTEEYSNISRFRKDKLGNLLYG